jgi:hypothetical protein
MGQRVVGPISRERRFSRRPGTEPFRIVVAAPVGGEGADRPPLSERRPLRIDLERFAGVLEASTPVVFFEEGGPWTVRTLEDLHPDGLCSSHPSLQALARLRARLLETSEGAGQSEPLPAAAGGGSLEALLHGRPLLLDDPFLPPSLDLSRFLRSVVADSVVHEPSPEAEAFASAVDEARTDKLREVLRHPGFRRLEALWRGIHRMVSCVELGETASLHLLDVSDEELSSSLEALPAALARAALSWNLVVLDTRLEPGPSGAERARALADLASRLDAPVLAEVAPEVLAPEHRETWARMDWPEPTRLGLAFPAVLARLPYGERTDPIETFPFEELPAEADAGDFRWGSAALACAQALSMGELELNDLPSCVVERDGERVLVPVTEVALDEQAEDTALALGLTPLIARRDRAALRMRGVQALGGGPLR